MFPEEMARVKIDRQLKSAGWDVVSRNDYIPNSTSAVEEALMQGNKESDYLLFVENKAIAVVEAKKEEDPLGPDVQHQAEGYAVHPQPWYGLWYDNLIPLVYMANGKKIYFKNLLDPEPEYIELKEMHTPKEMLRMIGKVSVYGALPRIERKGLHDCQYRAEVKFEEYIKNGRKRSLGILATGSGKTYLACLASYRLLNYTPVERVLFLVDRNNLARQTLGEYSRFDRTENGKTMKDLYNIKRLTKEKDINARVVISTIQKLFAVMTGKKIQEGNEDEEDERIAGEEEKEDKKQAAGVKTDVIQLGDHLLLPPDHFQLIIVDECHRSIYGKWKAVLDYFKEAHIMGLTATPTPEAFAFFDNSIIENYSFDESVVDGVNVPAREYRIITEITEQGGTIKEGSVLKEKIKRTGKEIDQSLETTEEYKPPELDRDIVNPQQIRKVLESYKKAIWDDLYPERSRTWEFIPKTLIFAKDENHATQIVEAVKKVFGLEFDSGEVPENFVQKITYTCNDTDGLIRDLRTEKDFRIAVTVTLVATGTDVKPLEVVLFMKDVQSDVLYTQMKGRGCRAIKDGILKEVTPNASTKECFYIVDAVGVTEHDKSMPHPKLNSESKKMVLPLVQLLERLAHGDVSDENLWLLRDYCSTIHKRYEFNSFFRRHLDEFISDYGFAPRTIAGNIQRAYDHNLIPRYHGPSGNNTERMDLIDPLITSIPARSKLLDLHKGYILQVDDDPDRLIYAGFSKETARSYIDNFEQYLNDHRDSIEALRIIYNSEDVLITHSMLVDLRDRLLNESRQFGVYLIWKNYKTLDEDGVVDELDLKSNFNALTNLLQLVRYAFRRIVRLTSLSTGYAQRFNLYCGQVQRTLTDDQRALMKRIAEYVINDGAISVSELNEADTDLWRQGVDLFGLNNLVVEMNALSRILLKVS